MARSVFTSRNVTTLEIPNTGGQTATIRQLAPRQLEMAAKEAQRQFLAIYREMAAEVKQAVQDVKPAEIEAAKVTDPLVGYDRVTLIVKGVLSWTLEEDFTPEHVEDLNDETRDFLATEVLRWTKPSLFLTEAQAEADRKNG